MRKKKTGRRASPFARQVEKAMRVAVAQTIEEHRRSGDPIVVWEKGRVVKVPAKRIPRRKA